MALHEAEHPLAQELQHIMLAAELGFESSKQIPAHIKLEYISPLDSVTGAAVLYIADRFTEKLTTVHVPVFTTSPSLDIITLKGAVPTEGRFCIADNQGRDLAFDLGGFIVTSPAIGLDLDEEGILFSAQIDNTFVTSYGQFESELYNSWAAVARNEASFAPLHEAATRFLDVAA